MKETPRIMTPSSVSLAPQVPDFEDYQNPEFLALNSGQQKAIEEVFSFFFSPLKEFMISGPAGTGKTHLMQFIMQHTLKEYKSACKLLGNRYVDYEIALCATTNKAAEVLAQATGFPAKTIHSFLGLKVKDNLSTGTSDIIKTRDWKVHHNTVIFIDEASMVDTALHTFILQGTDRSCKIIYLGDHCQMAPVFEKISPIYAQPTNVSTLTQPMRNAGQPALMALCNQLRRTTETLKFLPITLVPGVIDHVDSQGAYNFIVDTFTDEHPSARILAFSNARVQEYNQYIRELRGKPALFTAGERLVNNAAIPIDIGDQTAMLPIECEIEIISASDTVKTIHASNHPDSSFDVYDIEFVQIIKGKRSLAHRKQLPVDPDRFTHLVKAFSKAKNWDQYFWLKTNFPDFRQKDAATVYKAQGSTYHTVFLDLTNIGVCKHNDQLARMLYVGASRATTRLVLYGDLPARLFI